ncbi:MAG: HlyD family efflux transporter periplasmic adaptor subunit [Lactimicrobium sp.]|jgi:HlyD family secretion protein|uniref:HlyD family efflux transporter periplasmic adaptor subunit n=1 Tax=Lactimicrobium sp. TaxID=2563780 RepID=UPI002F355C76
MKKKGIIISVCIAAAIACSAGGLLLYRRNNTKTPVVRAGDAASTGLSDDSSLSGIVYEADNQSVYYDGTAQISEVYVTQDQQVHAGDKLLAYDLTSLQISVEMKQLAVQQAQNTLSGEQQKLNVLKNTQPIEQPVVTPTPEPTPTIEPTPAPLPEPQQDHDAWNIITADVTPYEPSVVPTASPSADPSASPSASASASVDPVPSASASAEPSASPTATAVPAGTTSTDPIRFIVQKDGTIAGNLFNKYRAMKPAVYLSFEIWEDNTVKSDGEPLSKWLVRSDLLPECADSDQWYVLTHQIVPAQSDTSVQEEDTVSADIDNTEVQDGYTAAELAKAIRDQARAVKEANLNVRRAQLDLKTAQESLKDGVVYAKRDGIVTRVSDPANPPQDGTAFLTVSSSSGTYIQSALSELQLDQVKPGDAVTVTDWNTGSVYDGTITSIDSDPTDGSSYSGIGNPNVSYYNFYIQVAEDMSNNAGSGVSVALTPSGSSTNMWLASMYVRDDQGAYYVLKEQDGKLVRQSVSVGNIMYDMVEIIDGISEDDWIAFPYGSKAKVGNLTRHSEESEVWQ